MADQKITALTADTSPTSDDLIVTVNDPGGTPANRRVTLANAITKAHGLSDGIVKVSSGTLTADTTGIDTTDLASGVLDTDLSSVSASDDTIPSAKATKTALDAKKTDSMSTNKLLGRGTAGTGVIEEITLGTNLSLSGTTLNATGGGSVTVEDENLIIGMRFFGF